MKRAHSMRSIVSSCAFVWFTFGTKYTSNTLCAHVAAIAKLQHSFLAFWVVNEYNIQQTTHTESCVGKKKKRWNENVYKPSNYVESVSVDHDRSSWTVMNKTQKSTAKQILFTSQTFWFVYDNVFKKRKTHQFH